MIIQLIKYNINNEYNSFSAAERASNCKKIKEDKRR